MTKNTANMDESNHSAENIETIVVDPDDIVEMMCRNDRDRNKKRWHCMRITPPFEATMCATPHVDREGNYYKKEMDPKPIHLGAEVFVIGENDEQLPSKYQYPSESESKARFREEFGYYDTDGSIRDLTASEFKKWGEWWLTVREVWEDRFRGDLVNEATITWPEYSGSNRFEINATIEYEETND